MSHAGRFFRTMSPFAFKLLCLLVPLMVLVAVAYDLVCDALVLCGWRSEARIFGGES